MSNTQKVSFLIFNGTIIVRAGGASHIFTPDTPQYRPMAELAERDNVTIEEFKAAKDSINFSVDVRDEIQPKASVEKTETAKDATQNTKVKVEFVNDYCFFGDYELPASLTNIVRGLYKNGERDFTIFNNFLRKLFSNPTKIGYTSVIDFVAKHGLTILPEGDFIAYKGVREDHYSCHGNLQTIVKRGKVDEDGRILNVIGETIEVDRDQVDMNRDAACSYGLHVGNYRYASGFGQVLMTVRVDPSKVCCVPHDSDWEKIRCCEYTPISFTDEKIEGTFATIENGPEESDSESGDETDSEETTPTKKSVPVVKGNVFIDFSGDKKELPRITEKIRNYIDKKLAEKDFVTLREVKGALPREEITTIETLEIIRSLGYEIKLDKQHITNTRIS